MTYKIISDVYFDKIEYLFYVSTSIYEIMIGMKKHYTNESLGTNLYVQYLLVL